MRKRKIILIILIVLLLIVGILAFLYYKTDILKTDEQLFWKYAVKNSELIQMFNNNDITEIEKQKINNSYKVDSNLDINTKSISLKSTLTLSTFILTVSPILNVL